MILEIYITLLAVSFIIIFLGYLVEDGVVLKVTGFLFLFSLGVMLIPGTAGTLEVQNGGTIITNATGTYVNNNYEVYENFTFGFYISLLSVFGFILAYTDRKNEKLEELEAD